MKDVELLTVEAAVNGDEQAAMQAGVLLGVDGGGTKTDVVVADVDGTTLASVRVGCTNHETVGMDRAMTELRRGVEDVLAAAGAALGDVRAAAFGLAGVDWHSDEVAIDSAIAGFGLGGVRTVVNDSLVALRAGSTDGWGIASSIGTGSVTVGVNRDGQRFRTMSVGWGEPCGSSSLVADALHAIAAEYHRTGPATTLTERFLHALSVPDVQALFEGISRGRLTVNGQLAPLLQQVAAEGDEVSLAVLDRSAVRHAAMVVGVADRLSMLDEAFELVTSGGVHVGGGRFVEVFAAHVRRHCAGVQIVPLRQTPVHGAVLLARDLI